EVLEVRPHPNADRLRLATVEAGGGPKTVVCGAPNLAAGQRIAFAEVGAQLLDGHTRKPTVLKASKIRGVESGGMVCSERELGLSDEHEGILVLPSDAPVGVLLRDVLGDTVLELASFAHRPDLESMLGVAREVSALTQQPLHEPDLTYATLAGPIEGRLTVSIEAPDLCPRYIAALIEDVQPGPSPAWMQERLLAAGMRPINTIVDITNYVMLEYGQPLHAFDYDRITDQRIIVRRARDGEQLQTLDGETRTLDQQMLVIADPNGPVALAGVIGGMESEVSAQTTRVLLEAANFNGIDIRATSMRLHLRSEASARFEKSIGPGVAMDGARRAVQLLVELAGGRAAQGFVDAYPGCRPPTIVTLSEQRIHQVLGIDVAPNDVRRVLGLIGFEVEGGPPEPYHVTVPYWRTDIAIPDDLIEEVMRILGYESMPMTALSGRIPELIPQPLRELRLQTQDLLVQAGMQEVITYSLIGADLLGKVHARGDGTESPLRIVKPMSSEHIYLRTSLRPSLLATLAANMRQRREQTGLFEVARVYFAREGDLPLEVEIAVAVLAGRRLDRWGIPGDEAIDFFDAKGIAESVLERLGIQAAFRSGEDPDLIPGQTAQVLLEDKQVGVIGQVHPEVATNFGLEEDVYLVELRLADLLPYLGRLHAYQPASRYPTVKQDLDLIVGEKVPAEEIQAVIARGRYVVEVRPWDVFTGGQIPPSHKSITFAVFYQAEDRTLTDAEVSQSQSRIEQQLAQRLGARLRES
ncbi:MAG: phenylalanine--tRNA ligase subunit beta, partial [Dehalococcoidia bacterium]